MMIPSFQIGSVVVLHTFVINTPLLASPFINAAAASSQLGSGVPIYNNNDDNNNNNDDYK